ncbi:MAG: hypothetical protein KDB22_06335 [Planctomycetales bacterium]|nr:hypothetical protein [Planctomycetales bacterium]
MKRLICLAITSLILVPSTRGFAQHQHVEIYSGSAGLHRSNDLAGHDYWYHHRHGPDLARLTALVGELEEVCRHLHEDAHGLSQDYRNSQAIETYVDRLDRLKVHMHEMLTDASRLGTYTSSLDQHIKHDTIESQGLLNDLYGLITGQTFEGARAQDHSMLLHMQEVILHEAYPLLSRVEVELYGHAVSRGGPASFSSSSPYSQSSRTVLRPTFPIAPVAPVAPPVIIQNRWSHGQHHSGHSDGYRRSSGGSVRIGSLRIQF